VYNGPVAERDYCGAMIGCGKNAGNALAAALVALLVVFSFTSTMIYSLILFLEKVAKIPLRVASVIESQGLDHSTHFGRAYTELQTTIFQYTTKSGEKASMEMRVRAGDAAKFALALSEVMDAEAGTKEGGSGRFSRLALSGNGGPEAGESGGGRRGFGSLLGNPASTIQESG
jgi:Amt family ammonium transporter